MKKTTLTLAAFLLGALPFAQATVVTFGAVPTARTVKTSTGALVTSGLILVGNFANEGFSFNTGLSIRDNFTAISTTGIWRQFTLDTITGTANAATASTLALSPAGRIGGSVTDNNFGATKADFFNNKSLYLWVFNAATVDNATEMGIFRATTSTIPWTFAVNAGGVGDSVTYSTTQSGASVIIAPGGVGSVAAPSGAVGDNGSLNLISVPEPSVLAMGGVAGLALLSSRRRKQGR